MKVHYTPDVCGSGIITGNEVCDDGNTANGDGCSSTCAVEDNFSCTGQPSVCAYENPQIPNSCGIDIALIIDSSGSIDGTELGQMKTAFKGFVDAFLPNTPSQFAVVEFDDTAALTQDYTNDITSIKGAIDSASSGGSTNWEDALEEAHAQFDNRANKPDIFIFASDGNPNRYGDSSTFATEATAVAQAVTDADAIKADGIRIITVGIGDNLDANNLIAISSADAYYDADFATLAADLAQLADDLCGGTVTVRKYVDGQPAQGWDFSAQASSGVLAESTGTTDIDGFATFNVENITGTASVDLAETLQGGYAFVNASCVADNQATGTIALNGVDDIAVGANDAVFCVVNNHLITFCGDSVTQNPNDAQVAEQCDVGASNGIACTPGYGSSCVYCDSSCGNVNLTGPFCGDQIVNGQEACEVGDQIADPEHYSCNAQTCILDYVPYCGDGNVDQGEFCDDSNNQDGDGCTNTCIIEICGDGIDNNGNNEACDDGNQVNDDACSNTCTANVCGDGVVNNGETCDDGVNNGVACEPGYNEVCDYCTSQCTPARATGPYCGDQIMNGAEECDGEDGVGAHQSCGETCLIVPLPYCGDNVINGQEACDDGNNADGDGCSANCAIEIISVCGDGVTNGAETCDDGNLADGDGCSANCAIEQAVCDPQVQLIANGGFEVPIVTDGTGWDIFPNGTSGLDWNVEWVGAYDGAPEIANAELHRGVNGWVSAEGQQHTELDSDWNGHSEGPNGEQASVMIYQDLATVPGETYNIRFRFSPRPGTDISQNVLEFYWDGVLQDTINAAGSGNTVWTVHEYNLTAADGSTRVAFKDAGTPNAEGTFLDDVSVLCTPAPEPFCGDGIVNQRDETCDDGVNNGVVCDPAYGNSCTYCDNACQPVNLTGGYCGDQIVNGQEQCDGTAPEHYSCTDNCALEYLPYCGDGIVNQESEQCDGAAPEGYACDAQCQLDELTCEEIPAAVLVSDTHTGLQAGGNASPVAQPYHPAWTANVPGALWIWDGSGVGIVNFTDSLTITGAVSGGATLRVASDNSYRVWINGVLVGEDPEEWNYAAGHEEDYDIASYLIVGENEFVFEVNNWHGPAGLMYRIVYGNVCEPEAYCGDGIVNQEDEQCDGDAPEGSVCGNGCELILCDATGTLREGETATDTVFGIDHETTLVFVSDPDTTVEAQFSLDGELTGMLGEGETFDSVNTTGLSLTTGDILVNAREGVAEYCLQVPAPVCGDGVVNQKSEQCDGAAPEGYTCFQDCSLHLTCEEAKSQGLLYGEIDSEGHAVVTNDADEDFLVTLASYEMYAPLIEDQELYSSDSQIVESDSSAEFSVTVPACAYQIDLICGEPLPNNPAYSEEEKLDFAFSEGLEYCVPGQDEGADLVVLKGFPQCGNYVFSCSAYGFEATNYYWYFGDGQIQPNSTNSDVYHTYEDDGTYTVTCTATNGEQFASASIEIEAVTCPTCEEAIAMGLLTGEIDSEGHAIVHNDANTNYTVSLASYEMYALLIEDQVLFDSDSADVAAFGGETELSVEVPACTYQIDLVCGSPLPFAPLYGDRVIDFDFANQDGAFCVPTGHEDEVTVDLSIGDGFPQGADYVFACDAQGFVPTGYYWYFGDGQIQPNSPNDNVWHTYTANGDYIVACTATNGTTWQTDTLLVSVEGIVDPSVTVSVDPEYPQGPAYVFLCEADGFTPLGYDWDFGDGEYLYDQPTADVYHAFSANGEYTVTCTASDGETTESGNVQATVEACGEYELLITQVDPDPAAPEDLVLVSGTLTVGGLPVETETVTLSLDGASQDASVLMGAWLGGFSAPTTPGEYLIGASFNGTCGEPVTASMALLVEVPQEQGGDGDSELFQTQIVEQPVASSGSDGGGRGDCAWGYHQAGGVCVKDAPIVETLAFGDGTAVAGGSGDGGVLPEEEATESDLPDAQDGTSDDLLTGAVIGGGLLSWSWLLVLLTILAILGGTYWWQQR